MWLYRTLFACDVLIVLMLGFFFLDGLQYNGGGYSAIWIPVLLVPVSALAGAWALKARDRTGLASALLAAVAILPVSAVAFYGLLIATGASWQ